jgi:hypothetical protein
MPNESVTVGIMDRSVDPPKWKGTVTINAPTRELKRGDKLARGKFRVEVEAKLHEMGLFIEALNQVHAMPEGIPPCDFVATVLPHEVSRAFAAKRNKSRPVMRGGKTIQRGHDVGVPTQRPKS